MNCYTYNVEPDEVTWRIGSKFIDSSFQEINGSGWMDEAVTRSQLLDSANQSYYRHYFTLNGSFSVGMSISCDVSVNGTTSSLTYELQGQWTIAKYDYYSIVSLYLQHPHNLPVVYQLPYCPVVIYPSVGCLYQVLMDTFCITMEERLY